MSTTEVKQGFIPSAYQKAIFEAGASGKRNIVVNATAGSGKTKTIQEFIMNYMPKGKSWIYLVFNKKNQQEAEMKLAKAINGRALTFHALGFGAIRRSIGSVQVENNKVIQIIRTESDVSEKSIWGTVIKVVGITKNTLTDANNYEAMSAMCERYNIDLNGSESRIFELVKIIINECKKTTYSIDFDDMIWLPIVLNLPMVKYDYVLVDEGQDLNAAQVEMVLRIRKSNGCVIVIGDRNQAIYGFRGAGINAMDVLSETLDALNLPLSISYRNPRAIVKLVNDTFPNIKHECSLSAPEGKVEHISQAEFRQTVKPRDMVLCRTNAPLVAPAFDLIRNGIKAIIMGKSIGEELENLINKIMKTVRSNEVEAMLERLEEYHRKQTAVLMSKNKEASAQALDDKVETINVLAEDCETVSEVVDKIKTVFSDEVDGVVFSSTHRAKGLESRNVFILRFDLMPHPRAIRSGNAWAIKEEENCKFVALTRTLNNLYIVE
jgi:superfamily I DNA/RNA helicase